MPNAARLLRPERLRVLFSPMALGPLSRGVHLCGLGRQCLQYFWLLLWEWQLRAVSQSQLQEKWHHHRSQFPGWLQTWSNCGPAAAKRFQSEGSGARWSRRWLGIPLQRQYGRGSERRRRGRLAVNWINAREWRLLALHSFWWSQNHVRRWDLYSGKCRLWTLSATTSSAGHNQQVIQIVQGSGSSATTTTVTYDLATGPRRPYSSRLAQLVPTSYTIHGLPENYAATPATEAAMLYVDGNITALSGPGQGQAAIQDGSAMTITAARTSRSRVTSSIKPRRSPRRKTRPLTALPIPRYRPLIPDNNKAPGARHLYGQRERTDE